MRSARDEAKANDGNDISSLTRRAVFRPSRADICVGLIGAGIQASLTPAMHVAEARAHGLDYEYRLIDIDALQIDAASWPALIDAAEQAGYAGLNVTYPLKQAVLAGMTELSDDARGLGSLNTVVLRSGRRIGHNTDWWGFAEAFKREFTELRRDVVALIGAGGAGAAVAHALLVCGVRELRLIEVDRFKGEALASSLTSRFPGARVSSGWTANAAIADADGIVNATPVGMVKLPGIPISVELIVPRHWVIDIIYFPLESELLRHARALGCRVSNGGGMVVFQAIKAFELFTGLKADTARMQAHFSALASSVRS